MFSPRRVTLSPAACPSRSLKAAIDFFAATLGLEKEVAKITDAEVFVAWITCGIPPDNFKIASSFRYPLDHILDEHY